MNNLSQIQNAVQNSQSTLANTQLQAASGKRIVDPSQDIVTQAISDQMNFKIKQGEFVSTAMGIGVEKLNLISGRLDEINTQIESMITAANTANSTVADAAMRSSLETQMLEMTNGINTILESEDTFKGRASTAEVHTRNDNLSFVSLPTDSALSNLSPLNSMTPVGALNINQSAFDGISPALATLHTLQGVIGGTDVAVSFNPGTIEKADVNNDTLSLFRINVTENTISSIFGGTTATTVPTSATQTTLGQALNFTASKIFNAGTLSLNVNTNNVNDTNFTISDLDVTKTSAARIGTNQLESISAKKNSTADLDVILSINGTSYTGKIVNGYTSGAVVSSAPITFTNASNTDALTFTLEDGDTGHATNDAKADYLIGKIAKYFTGAEAGDLTGLGSAYSSIQTITLGANKNTFNVGAEINGNTDMTKVKFTDSTNNSGSITFDLSGILSNSQPIVNVVNNLDNALKQIKITPYAKLGTVTVKDTTSSETLFTFDTTLTASSSDRQKLIDTFSSIGILKGTSAKADLRTNDYESWISNKIGNESNKNTFFKGFLDPNKTQGFVDGRVEDILVTDIGINSNGKTMTQITIKTDKETFTGVFVKKDLKMGDSIVLTGNNTFNTIGLLANRSFVATDTNNQNNSATDTTFKNDLLQQSLRVLFGTSTGSNVTITAPSMSNQSINKALGGSRNPDGTYSEQYEIVAGSGMSVGSYAFRYNYDQETQKGMAYLTNGTTTLTTVLDNAMNNLNAYKNPLTFSNGFQITPKTGASFDLTKDIAQFTMNVSGIEANPFNIQTTLNGGINRVNLGPLNTRILGIEGAFQLGTADLITATKAKLDLAKSQVSDYKSRVFAQIRSIQSSNKALKSELQGYQAIEQANNTVDPSENFEEQSKSRNQSSSANHSMVQALLDRTKLETKYQQAQAQAASASG